MSLMVADAIVNLTGHNVPAGIVSLFVTLLHFCNVFKTAGYFAQSVTLRVSVHSFDCPSNISSPSGNVTQARRQRIQAYRLAPTRVWDAIGSG